MTFFQQESKFVVGESYEMIRVLTDYRNPAHQKLQDESFDAWIERCDEVGEVLEDPPVLMGKYVKSVSSGSGDGGTRFDFFDLDGSEKVNGLLDDGSTRYRRISQ